MSLKDKISYIIKNDDIVSFRKKINQNRNINLNECLKNCCIFDSYSIAKFLIKEKNIDITSYNHLNFINLCYFGNIKIIKMLLKNKNNSFSEPHNLPFNAACSSLNNEVAKLLLIERPQLNCFDSIVSAAYYKNKKLLKILFNHDKFEDFNINLFKNPDPQFGFINILINNYPKTHKYVISYFSYEARNHELDIIQSKIDDFKKIEQIKNNIEKF